METTKLKKGVIYSPETLSRQWRDIPNSFEIAAKGAGLPGYGPDFGVSRETPLPPEFFLVDATVCVHGNTYRNPQGGWLPGYGPEEGSTMSAATPAMRRLLLALLQGKVSSAIQTWREEDGVFPDLLPEEAAIIRKWMGCGSPPPGGKRSLQKAMERLFPR